MKITVTLLIAYLCIFSTCCKSETNENYKDNLKTSSRFRGNFVHTFRDLPELHLAAASANGITPLENRSDTVKCKDKLVRIPDELPTYKIAKLKFSIPYLVKKASVLLSDISVNFRDSLISKKKPLYKLVITSMMRTNEDVKKLTRRNFNASENSAHRFGTTFDIAWYRYEKADLSDKRTLDSWSLKQILGQVLNDLRNEDRCYIKYERKQSCFHITVR